MTSYQSFPLSDGILGDILVDWFLPVLEKGVVRVVYEMCFREINCHME